MSALSRLGWRLLDLAGYAVGLTATVAVLMAPLSLLAGAGLAGVKYGLFVAGVLAFGYATLLAWPVRPDEEGPQAGPGSETQDGPAYETRGDRADPTSETSFESLLARLPPFEQVDPVERFHPGTKLYVASLLMLAVSYGLEAMFGVRA